MTAVQMLAEVEASEKLKDKGYEKHFCVACGGVGENWSEPKAGEVMYPITCNECHGRGTWWEKVKESK